MKIYLFKGLRYQAKSKEDLLRRFELSPYDKKNKTMVIALRKRAT